MEKVVQEAIIKKCETELSNKINKHIKKELTSLDAIDEALKEYQPDEEIILKYEFEVLKKNYNGNKNLDVSPEQIDYLMDKIKKLVYNKFVS